MLAAREFLLIMGLGLIVAGLTAYVIVWMLVAVHLRDHHPDMRKPCITHMEVTNTSLTS